MFFEEIEKVAKAVKPIIKEKNVKIFFHYDADGITSASIFSKMLIRENVNFQLRALKQLTKNFINSIIVDKNDFIVFLDFGSGQLDNLKKILDITQVLIIDHHQPSKYSHVNLFHLNPLLFKDEEVPSAMITYLFAKFFDKKNLDLIDLAVIGALADAHEDELKLKEISSKIFKEAEMLGKISVTKDLKFYGRSKPIHQSLAFSFDPFIPGVSGSESQAVQFLSEIGIPIMYDNEIRRLKDLTKEEKQKLATAIISERIRYSKRAEDIFGNVYTLIGKPEEIQDVREFGTLINACGRTGNAGLAIRLCLNDYLSLSRCLDILIDYRKMVGEALGLLREKEIISKKEFANFIIGGNKVPDSIIGTITSVALHSNLLNEDKPVLGLAESSDNMIKISARLPEKLRDLNLGKIIRKAAEVVGGEGGGHERAAGALIPKEKQEEFINIINSLLGEMIGNKKS
jgi:RecJ-like exonuclease